MPGGGRYDSAAACGHTLDPYEEEGREREPRGEERRGEEGRGGEARRGQETADKEQFTPALPSGSKPLHGCAALCRCAPVRGDAHLNPRVDLSFLASS